jgi:hypothetical protein
MKPISVFFLSIFINFNSLYYQIVAFRLSLALFLSYVVNVLAAELSQDLYVPIQAKAVDLNCIGK